MYFLSIRKTISKGSGQKDEPKAKGDYYLIMKKLIFLIPILILGSCVEPSNPYSAAAPGRWRGVLYLDSKSSIRPAQDLVKEGQAPDYAQKGEGELPFLFDVVYDSDTSFHIEVLNGEEKIIIRDIKWGRDRSVAKDTMRIEFSPFNSFIHTVYEEGVMQGFWYDRNRGPDYKIPFAAFYGNRNRFVQDVNLKPETDFGGEWRVEFGTGDEVYDAIAEFRQNSRRLEGTFRTATGDYRFLAGLAEENKMYLSTFDGTHAYLFHGKQMPDGTIQGFFKSGNHYVTNWKAWRDDDFELPPEDSLTYMRGIEAPFNPAFMGIDGQPFYFGAPDQLGKVQVVQIMGTWCPNCKDETEFLIEYLKENPSEDLEVIAVAFEKQMGQENALRQIRAYKEKMGIPYRMLWGGYYRKKDASAQMPMLNEVISYPTLLFIDKENKVRKIKTGFNGPATSKYEETTRDIAKTIEDLLAE
jgi:thiol-disulfide isomerase/thioredoxin